MDRQGRSRGDIGEGRGGLRLDRRGGRAARRGAARRAARRALLGARRVKQRAQATRPRLLGPRTAACLARPCTAVVLQRARRARPCLRRLPRGRRGLGLGGRDEQPTERGPRLLLKWLGSGSGLFGLGLGLGSRLGLRLGSRLGLGSGSGSGSGLGSGLGFAASSCMRARSPASMAARKRRLRCWLILARGGGPSTATKHSSVGWTSSRMASMYLRTASSISSREVGSWNGYSGCVAA